MIVTRDRFAGRRAVITGGASGIGFGVASRLAAEGASVALWDLDEGALARATEAFGGKSLCLQQCRLIPQLRFADRVLAGSFPTGWYMRPVNLLSAVDKAYESYLAISI